MTGPFYDDATHQLSLARILCAIIIVYVIGSMWGKDIPVGWCGLVIALYFGNKGASVAAGALSGPK